MNRRQLMKIGVLTALAVVTLGMGSGVNTEKVYAQEIGMQSTVNRLGADAETSEAGCMFDEVTGKLTITSDFKWQVYPWQYTIDEAGEVYEIDPLKIITAEVDLSGTQNLEDTEDEYYFEPYFSSLFGDCSNLQSVKFTGEVNSSYEVDMSNMFRNCGSLTSVDLSGFADANIVDMGYLFSYCSNLETVDLSKLDVSNVTNVYDMFYDCKKLKTITFGNDFNTEKVTDMSSLFYGCSSLETIDLSGLNVSNVTEIYGMFSECSALKTVTFGKNFNMEKVADMGSLFSGCSNLETVDLSGVNTSGVTNMRSMFSECNGLKTITFGGKFDTSNVTDMSEMFYGCSSLKTLDLKGFDTANVTNMWCMFDSCSSLTALDVSSFNTENVEDMSYMFYGCHGLTQIDVSNFNFGKIGNESLTDTIDGRPITLNNMDCMFSYMNNVKTIKVPANLPFAVYFPMSDTIPENVEVYWQDASGVTYEMIKAGLNVPMTYTRVEKVISVPAPQPQQPTSQGNSTSTTNQPTQKPVPLAKGKKITDKNTSGKYTVNGSKTVAYTGTTNKKAKTIKIPDKITYGGITYKVTAISAKALRNNKKVTTVNIGANITKIEKSAFEGCSTLKKITIKSKNLKSVGKNAFKGIHKNCKIKVPSSKLTAYKKLLKGKGQKSTVKISK